MDFTQFLPRSHILHMKGLMKISRRFSFAERVGKQIFSRSWLKTA